MRLWQYQALVEPIQVTATPEIVTVDKWFAPTEQPQRHNASRRHTSDFYMAVEIGIDLIVPVGIEAVVAARVDQPYRRNRRPPVYPAYFGPVDVSYPETPQLDKWYFHPQEPQRRRIHVARINDNYDIPNIRQESRSPEDLTASNVQYLRPASRRHLYPSVFRPDQDAPALPVTNPALFMAAVRQTPIPFLRHKSRRHMYPATAFKDPMVLYFPYPPLTDWTPESAARTNWEMPSLPRTDWDQGLPRELGTIDYNAVLDYNATVYYNGYDTAATDGQPVNPPNTDWGAQSVHTATWGGRAVPSTNWGKRGGSDG